MREDIRELSPAPEVYRFGSLAVYRKYVTLEQVQTALAKQMEDDVMRRPHRYLGEILLEHGWIAEEQIRSILEEMGLRTAKTIIARIFRTDDVPEGGTLTFLPVGFSRKGPEA